MKIQYKDNIFNVKYRITPTQGSFLSKKLKIRLPVIVDITTDNNSLIDSFAMAFFINYIYEVENDFKVFRFTSTIDKEVIHNVYTEDTVKKYLRCHLNIKVFHFEYQVNLYLFPPELDLSTQAYDRRINK